jgi:hypothetical protein
MTRVQFLSVAVVGVLLAALAGGVSAAPVPKGAGANNPTPDLKAFFDTAGKAVKDEKWPVEADEKLLRDTARAIFERATKAAEQKDRKLPVEFDKLTKLDVVGEHKADSLDGNFLIAKDVQVRIAKNSVIFASGDVQITSAQNCVIVAQNVRCTGVENCAVVAGEFFRVTSAGRPNGGDGSVVVAGQWIRATRLDGTICHVLRPGSAASPEDLKFRLPGPHPAIRTNGADNVTFLNAQEETGANGPKNCTYLPQKTPIAK